MSTSTGRFDGVRQILRYNVHYYLASLAVVVVAAALIWFHLAPPPLDTAVSMVAGLVAFWSLSSLAVSYYVYDYAAVTRWEWLRGMLTVPPRAWANVHAGLDQSTAILKDFYPGAEYVVIDIFDPDAMTEPSIARARRLHPATHGAISSKASAVPLPDQGTDTVFLLFVAHELRRHSGRVEFLREIERVLAPSGQVLLVEHLRDWKNFVAFGPGFLHFFSRREWLCVIREAMLKVRYEQNVTPFVRCFIVSKPCI